MTFTSNSFGFNSCYFVHSSITLKPIRMRNKTQSLNKLLLLKIKIAKVNELELITGGTRRSRKGNSKTGDTRAQFQMQAQAYLAIN